MTVSRSTVYPELNIGAHDKGFPYHAAGKSISEISGKISLTSSGFTSPVLLLSDSALDRNLSAMKGFCEESRLSLAPHAKTTMSPEIISRQFDYGAWAATVANCTQAAAVRSLGVDRILIANEVVDPVGIKWLGAELDRDEGFTALCYVDSAAGVVAFESALSARGQRRPVPVLLEYGVAGGRAGTRTLDEALNVAALVANSAHLSLAGIAGFEGILGADGDLGEVISYLRDLRTVADKIYDRRAAEADEFIVTVGGSSFVELVRDEFSTAWRAKRAIRVVLRSGCYATHDSGACAKMRMTMTQRVEPLILEPALELWARVLSRPEPELAILDFGKRDVGIDAGFPTPQHILYSGSSRVEPSPPCAVTGLNDQHAYLRLTQSAGNGGPCRTVAVGDLIGFGISHPCTTFDKWRVIPIVDDDRTLIDVARTWF